MDSAHRRLVSATYCFLTIFSYYECMHIVRSLFFRLSRPLNAHAKKDNAILRSFELLVRSTYYVNRPATLLAHYAAKGPRLHDYVHHYTTDLQGFMELVRTPPSHLPSRPLKFEHFALQVDEQIPVRKHEIRSFFAQWNSGLQCCPLVELKLFAKKPQRTLSSAIAEICRHLLGVRHLRIAAESSSCLEQLFAALVKDDSFSVTKPTPQKPRKPDAEDVARAVRSSALPQRQTRNLMDRLEREQSRAAQEWHERAGVTLLECNFNDYSFWPENFSRFLGSGLGETLRVVRLSGHDVNKEDEAAIVA